MQANHVVPSCCCRFFLSLSLFSFPAGVWRLCRRATWPLYKSSHSRLEVCAVSASPRPVFLPLPHPRLPVLPSPHLGASQRDSLTQASLSRRLLFLCLLHLRYQKKKEKIITGRTHALWLKQQTDVQAWEKNKKKKTIHEWTDGPSSN